MKLSDVFGYTAIWGPPTFFIFFADGSCIAPMTLLRHKIFSQKSTLVVNDYGAGSGRDGVGQSRSYRSCTSAAPKPFGTWGSFFDQNPWPQQADVPCCQRICMRCQIMTRFYGPSHFANYWHDGRVIDVCESRTLGPWGSPSCGPYLEFFWI